MDFSNTKEFIKHLTDWRIPGNAISVYHNGEEVFFHSTGYSDVENNVPMRGDELINIYSCSKVSTVVAALQLYEKGLFLLDDPLYDFIPEYREMYIKDKNGEMRKAEKPITLRHLFTMTAGLTYQIGDWFDIVKKETNGKMDTCVVAKHIASAPLIFEPGERWNYSLCHDVLGAVIEIISGERFSEYVKKHIFEPLGVKDLYYHRNDEIFSRMASEYRYETEDLTDDIVKAQVCSGNKEGKWVKTDGKPKWEFGEGYDSGGAGIVTSVREYAKLGGALANGGKCPNGEYILGKGTIDLLRTNQLSPKQSETFSWSQLKGYGYGLGVRTMIDVAKSGSNGSIGEFGWGGAAGATMMVDPDTNFSYFYAHHMLNPQEEYYQPRLRNVLYSCLYK